MKKYIFWASALVVLLAVLLGTSRRFSGSSLPSDAMVRTVALETDVQKKESLKDWTRQERKTFRKKLRKEWRKIKKSAGSSASSDSGNKPLLILLTILGAAALLFLLFPIGFVLAYALGSEAVIWVVLIVGGIGILWLAFSRIRKILKKE